MVRWASKAMYQNPSAETTSKLKSIAETIVLEGRNPHAIASIVGTVHEDSDEEIM